MKWIKKGYYFEACNLHPMRCTKVYRDGIVDGISLLDGQLKFCDIYSCGVRKIGRKRLLKLTKAIKEHGELGLFLANGYTKEGYESFIKEWRSPVTESK